MHLLQAAECLPDHRQDRDQDLHLQAVECLPVDLRKDLGHLAPVDLHKDLDHRDLLRLKEDLDHRDPLRLQEDLDHPAVYLHLQDLVRQEVCHLDVLNLKCRCNVLDRNKHLWELEEREDKELSKPWNQ